MSRVQSNVCRSFLQSVMCHGMLTRAQAEQEIRRLVGLYSEEGTREREDQHIMALEDIMEIANRKLALLDLELRIAISENDALHYIVLINNRPDELSKKLTDLVKPSEAKFFKLVLKDLLRSQGKIEEIEAISLRSKVSNLSDAGAREVIAHMCQRGFLQRDPMDRRLFIGPKTHMELKQHLISLRENNSRLVGTCFICSDICIRGLSCSNPACTSVRVHFYCADHTYPESEPRICRNCNDGALEEDNDAYIAEEDDQDENDPNEEE